MDSRKCRLFPNEIKVVVNLKILIYSDRFWYDIQKYKQLDASDLFVLGSSAGDLWDKYFDKDSPLADVLHSIPPII